MTAPRSPRAPRATLAPKRRVPARAPARVVVPETPRVEPPIAPPPPPPPPPRKSRIIPATLLFVALLIIHIAVSLAIGEFALGRVLITLEYAVPCGVAMALFGLMRWQTRPWTRVIWAGGIALLTWTGALLGGAAATLAFFFFLLFLPIWTVLAVTGTGRVQWTPLQFTGATLVLEALWIPLYNSFPDLTQLATASGTLEAYTLTQLYSIVTTKFLHESLLILVGIFLLARRFPLVQKDPERSDWHATWRALGAHNRHPMTLTIALGATTFLVALFGTLLLQSLFSGTPVAESGADDTRVFERITPELVILLSFAAGLGEELIFRAILLPALERTFRRAMPAVPAAALAIVLQALCFGVVHSGYGNLLHVLLPFAFGLLTGVVYRFWGLVPALYAHFMIDVFAFGFDASQNYSWIDPALTILLVANLFAGVFAPLWLLVTWAWDRFGGRRGAEPVSAPKP